MLKIKKFCFTNFLIHTQEIELEFFWGSYIIIYVIMKWLLEEQINFLDINYFTNKLFN